MPANASVDGVPAEAYPIPPWQPRGEVRLVSLGLANVQLQGVGGAATRVLRVRLIVTNAGGAVPWIIDTRAIVLSLSGVDRSLAAYAKADAGVPPVVQIAPGQRGTVDLYYPLPAAVRDPEQVPAFYVEWQIQTGRGVVGQRTPFRRVEPPQVPPSTHFIYGGYYSYPSD
ncbi:MAG TPA: hypothetical protein VGQ83_01545 [Polyangia bacterium]|jgi:hypothetical protein